MALVHTDWRYLKILSVSPMNSSITWEVYRNAEMRNTPLDEFSVPANWSLSVSMDLDTPVDAEKNLVENLKTLGYVTLKATTFPEWQDA